MTQEQATEILKKNQAKLDSENCTIKIIDDYELTGETRENKKYNIINHVLKNPHSVSTKKIGGEGNTKKYRKQNIGNSRSMQDLYFLVKHYIPDIQMAEIAKTLNYLRSKHRLEWWFCSTHRKVMFRREDDCYSGPRQQMESLGIYY